MTPNLAFVLAVPLAVGCTTSKNTDFCETCNQPGGSLAPGGAFVHQNVQLVGQATILTASVFQFTTTSTLALPPLSGVGGSGSLGPCIDASTGAYDLLLSAPSGVTPLAIPGPGPNGAATLTGTGITGTVDVPMPNQFGTGSGTTTLATGEAVPGGSYSVDIGEGSAIAYKFAPAFTPPLGIGGSATVMIPANKALALTWDAPPDDLGPNDATHEPDTYFNLVIFADVAHGTTQFVCFMDVYDPGKLTVPAAVVSQLVPQGLILEANFTDLIEARHNPHDTAETTDRRFDVVTMTGGISQYMVQ